MSSILFADGTTQVRLEPHGYLGPRGDEPNQQVVYQLVQDWERKKWKISLGLSGEFYGRRDTSIDIPEAWYSVSVKSFDVKLGRIHPWHFSKKSIYSKIWNFEAQYTQSFNRGVLLGNNGTQALFPMSQMSGWLGMHVWSDKSRKKNIQWGLSVTPYFLPSLGPEVILSEDKPLSTSRFGRRTPESVLIENQYVPLRYKIDQSRVYEDVINNPQMDFTIHFKNWPEKNLKTWLSVRRQPQPNPESEVNGFVQVTNNGVFAMAEVQPKFPSYWQTSMTQVVGFPHADFYFTIFDRQTLFGYDMGIQSKFFYLNYSDLNDYLKTDPLKQDQYGEHLVQLELRLPIKNIEFATGLKSHAERYDMWVRNRVRLNLGKKKNTSLEVGNDLFAGANNTYFGEWRSNDRIYFAINWIARSL
jgi:hypothetical protein